MNLSKTPEKLLEFIRLEAEESGYGLVDIIVKGSRTFFIEIVLDAEGGITLGECADFNKRVMKWVNTETDISEKFVLDVCSPGLDRELKSESSFLWGKGKQVEVRVREAADGKNVISGKLIERTAHGDILIKGTCGKEFSVDGGNVIKTKLKAEYKKR
ncbi:MAG: hypothetical protein ISS33_03310 [Candidatus Omnitrophica bacterium]|nr:hypothetical protein [Candidatus Omnitrophota bacterium]